MKKILLALLILFIPSMVLADSTSPHILGYDAVIINKNGVKYDDGEGIKTIKYNTSITVTNEWDDEAYACTKSGDSCFTVPIKDIAPLKKEIVPKDLLKKDNMGTTLESHKETLFVYNKKGIKLKKGPAEAYGTYDKVIPYKEIIHSTYAVHFEGHGGGYTWFYVDEENYKGWISNESDIAYYSTHQMILFEDVKLYNIDTNEVIDTIPVETVFEEYYSGDKVYLTYKDKFGYIDANKVGSGDYYYRSYGYKNKLGYIFTTKSIEMKDGNGKAITAIPKGERIKILYASMEDDEVVDYPWHNSTSVCMDTKKCFYYVEYNNLKGFVEDKNVVSLYHEEKPKTVSYDEDLVIYKIEYYDDSDDLYDNNMAIDEYTKKYETDEILPAGTKVTMYYWDVLYDQTEESRNANGSLTYTIELIKYGNNKLGWVVSKVSDDRVYYNNNDTNTDITIPQKDYDIPITKQGFVMSKTMESIINGIMIAIIASSLALSLIFIVNRKKKNEG